MKNETLEKIKKFAVSEIMKESGYCGVAESDDMALLNGELVDGQDVKIKIEIVKEYKQQGGLNVRRF